MNEAELSILFKTPAVPALRRPSWKFSLFIALAQKTAHYSISGTADGQARIDRSDDLNFLQELFRNKYFSGKYTKFIHVLSVNFSRFI